MHCALLCCSAALGALLMYILVIALFTAATVYYINQFSFYVYAQAVFIEMLDTR